MAQPRPGQLIHYSGPHGGIVIAATLWSRAPGTGAWWAVPSDRREFVKVRQLNHRWVVDTRP